MLFRSFKVILHGILYFLLCLSLNIPCLVVELDAKAVVDVLRNYNYDNTIISPIMDDCRKLVSCFQQIQIKHCYWQANRCADLLAKIRVEQEIDFLNYLSPPVDFLQILQEDRNGLYVNRICHDSVVSL